jgi:hypothetical protein
MGFECRFGTPSTLPSTGLTPVSLRFSSLLVIVPRIVDVRKSVRVFHIGQPAGTRSVPRASGLVLVGISLICVATGLGRIPFNVASF